MFRLRMCLIIACLAHPAALTLAQEPIVVSVASPTDLKQITERGRLLYQYDQAAWHATDAVRATNPKHEEMGRYIGAPTAKGWVVAFGHLNDARDAFLTSYLATEGKNLQEFTVEHFVSPQRDTGFYLFAAKAIDLALKSFHGEKRPYDVAVLPAQKGLLCVYVYRHKLKTASSRSAGMRGISSQLTETRSSTIAACTTTFSCLTCVGAITVQNSTEITIHMF